MKIKYIIVLLILFIECKKKNIVQQVKVFKNTYVGFLTYDNYIEDLQMIKNLENKNCKKIEETFGVLKTIDGKEKLFNESKASCENIQLINKQSKIDNDLLMKLGDILSEDQLARDKFHAVVEEKGLKLSPNVDVSKMLSERKYYWDLIVKESDSINAIKFSKIIDSVGEWIGFEYLARTSETPNIGIIVGHLPEKEYIKFTTMAFGSARKGKEYWNRVEKMINYSKKYFIEDSEYIKKRKIIIPFRFTNYQQEGLIDEDSDLTKLEFNSIAKSVLSSNNPDELSYELSSSIQDPNVRKKLLGQAKNLLVKYGWKENLIKLKRDRESHDEYSLYYQVVN